MAQIIPLFKRMATKEPKQETNEKNLEKFFLFSLSGKAFAIPAVDVSEVAAYSSLIDIPKNSEIISGVVNVRGNVIPVINLRKRLDLPDIFQIDDKTKIIYFKVKQDLFIGMIVDDIEFKLVEGRLLPKQSSEHQNNKDSETIFMEEKNINSKYPVFFVESYIKSEEFEDIQKVLDSF